MQPAASYPLVSHRIVTYFGGGLVVGGVATLLRRSVQVAEWKSGME